MFIGEFSHNLDEKGRMALPAKFREQLSAGAIVTRGLDHCLFVYSREEWEKWAAKLSQLPVSQKKSRALVRHMLAGAWDVEFDAQGRINIPEYLRTYASLTKKVTVAGLFNRVELWDADTWRYQMQATEASSDDIAESLGELGI
jgi:MraZ protein